MESEETLYIKILVWAYYQGEDGFTWKEMIEKFNLSDTQSSWATEVFRKYGDELFSNAPYKPEHTYIVTTNGSSIVIDYLNLKEAENNGKRAEKIAVSAIIIGIIVGISQIITSIYFR